MTDTPTGENTVFVPLDRLQVRRHAPSGDDTADAFEIDGTMPDGSRTVTVREADIDALAAAATVIGRWLTDAPSADVLTTATDPAMLEQWPLSGDRATRRGLRLLARWRESAETGETGEAGETGMERAAEAVRLDHQHLFVGPGHATASPYESVHRSAEGLLFDESTLDVRAWYHHFGVSAPREGKEPDDHIGLELEFLAALFTSALDSLAASDDEQASGFVAAAAQFTTDHLAQWAPAWFRLVAETAETDFHRGLAQLGLGLLDALASVLPGVELAAEADDLI